MMRLDWGDVICWIMSFFETFLVARVRWWLKSNTSLLCSCVVVLVPLDNFFAYTCFCSPILWHGSSSSLISWHFSQLAVESFRFIFLSLSSPLISEPSLNTGSIVPAALEPLLGFYPTAGSPPVPPPQWPPASGFASSSHRLSPQGFHFPGLPAHISCINAG